MLVKNKLILLELIASIFGWVWIIALLATLYFFVAAILFNSPWSRFFLLLVITIVAKWLTKGFLDNQKRIAFEEDLIAKGYSRDDAYKEWCEKYMGNKI